MLTSASGIGPVLGEDAVAQVAVDDQPALLARRDRRQPAVLDERPDASSPSNGLVGHQSSSIGAHRTMPRMLPSDRRLGAHLPLATGMVKAVERAHEIGATTMQICTDNPTAWTRRAEPPAELDGLRRAPRRARHPAGRDPRRVPVQPGRAGRGARSSASIDILAGELRGAPTFGARFVNVHIGSHRGTGVDAGTSGVAEGVRPDAWPRSTTARDAAMLVLENSVGGGWGLGHERRRSCGIADGGRRAGVPRHAVGLLPRHGPRLGRRHRPRRLRTRSTPRSPSSTRASASIAWSWSTSTTRARSAARARTATSTSARAGSGRSGSATCCATRAWPMPPYILETPGMDEGYDAINLDRARALRRGPAAGAAARRRRSSCAAAPRARTAPA